MSEIALVAAVAGNGVIGKDGGLPWRQSTDLRRFKAQTMGKPIVMGRKTWDSIGRPLPGRRNIVVTRNRGFAPEGAETATSLDEALAMAGGESEEICVIGGGELYRHAMPLADRLYVTHILAEIDGDTHFPEIDGATWRPVHEEAVPAGEKDVYPTRYVVYERRREGNPSRAVVNGA